MGGNTNKENHELNIQYFQGDKLMDLNIEHYWPSFIAKDVNELRNIKGLRQTMAKFRILP